MKFLTPALILIASIGIGSVAYAHDTNDQTVCPAIYAPVCASHQVQCVKAPCYPVYQTYGNSCEAGAQDAAVIHQGECTATETGPIKPSEGAYTPPAGCVAWFDGCNSCSKTVNGTICTKKACFAPAAGYCTQYVEQNPPVTTNPEPPVATSTTPTTTPATTTPATPEPFWQSVWTWIKNLFGW